MIPLENFTLSLCHSVAIGFICLVRLDFSTNIVYQQSLSAINLSCLYFCLWAVRQSAKFGDLEAKSVIGAVQEAV